MAVALNRFDHVQAISLRSLYVDDAQQVDDVDWLADAGDAGWSGVTQNFEIVRDPLERQVIIDHSVRVFSLSKATWSAHVQGMVLGRNLLRMTRRMRRDDGCFWRISEREPLKDIP